MLFASKNGRQKLRQKQPRKASGNGRKLRAESLESRFMLSTNAGLPDATFGDGGKVFTDIQFESSAIVQDEQGRAVATYLSNGQEKIVVAGVERETHLVGYLDLGDELVPIHEDRYDMIVARYNEEGSLDSSFGVNGVTRIDFGEIVDWVNDVAVDSQGRIIVAGRSGNEMAFMRLTVNGSLDVTFGEAGKQVYSFGELINEVAIDSSDRIVIAGYGRVTGQNETAMAVARLTDAGELDATFGVGGTLLVDFEGVYAVAEAISMDDLGRIVVAGTSNSGQGSGNPNDFAIARLTVNGILDTTFGSDMDGDLVRDGRTLIDFDNSDDQAYGIAIDSLNRVIVGGTKQDNTVNFAVARLTSSGELDANYGIDGKQIIAVDGQASGGYLTVDAFGRAIIAGSQSSDGNVDMFAARLTAAGALDTSFGVNGTKPVDFSNQSEALDVAIDAQGRIVLAGRANQPSVGSVFAAMRLTGNQDLPADGNNAPAVAADHLYAVWNQGQVALNRGAFGDINSDTVTLTASAGAIMDNGDGTWSWAFDTAYKVTPDQSVTITATDSHGATANATFNLVINRTPRAGLLDASFSDDGRVFVGIDSTASRRTVGHQSDGKLVGAFWSEQRTLVLRYNVDGSPDLTFGVNGQAVIDFGASGATFFYSAGAMAIDELDRVVIAGGRGIEGEGWGFGVVRLSKDGVLETSFGDNGLQSILLDGFGASAESVAIDSQQRIVIGGYNFTDGGITDFAVARLAESGELDFKRTIDVRTSDLGFSVAIDSQDRIILAGGTNDEAYAYTGNTTADWDMMLIRFSEAGEVDLQQTIDFGIGLPWGYSAAVDSQDRIVLASSVQQQDGDGFDFVVRRLTSSGDFDFQKTINFGSTNIPLDVAVDSRDRIIVVGSTYTNDSTSTDFAVTRLTADGEFDALFGSNGQQETDFGFTQEDAYGVAIDVQDRIVVIGTSDRGNAPEYEPVLARLTSGNDTVTIAAQHTAVVIDAGQTAANTGLFASIDATAIRLSASLGTVVNNADGTWSWTFATTTPAASQTVTITATDLFGFHATTSFQLTVAIPPVENPEELASAISELPPGTVEVQIASTPVNLPQFVEAITELPSNTSGEVIDIIINLDGGDYQESGVIDVPSGYRVIINGASGQVIFHGNSPSLIVQSGDVLITGVTFVNGTDASTIVVTGGSLTVRNSSIIETTGGARAAIEITGGSLNLGTVADPGGNTIELSGPGDFVRNLTGNFVPSFGNFYQVGSTTITSDIVVEAGKRLSFDPTSGELILASNVTIVAIDLRPTSLNIDQNGSISLVIFGSSLFDVSQVSIGSLSLAGVGIDVFNRTFTDDNHDGKIDLLLQFSTSSALKSALTAMYSDLLEEDYSDDLLYSTKQQSLVALDGVFGELGQAFQGSDSTELFLAGKSLKTLITSLGI